jgi:hypothetical protein
MADLEGRGFIPAVTRAFNSALGPEAALFDRDSAFVSWLLRRGAEAGPKKNRRRWNFTGGSVVSLEPISLRLQGRAGWLRPGSLLVAVRAFWGLLHHLDLELSREPKGTVDWEISAMTKKSGPALIVFIGHLKTPPKDCLPEIRKALINGVHILSHSGERPDWFSDPALEKLKVLAEQNASMDEIAVIVGEKEERLEASMAERIARLTGHNYETLTSIVGTLESISVNRGTRLRVSSEITGQGVTCRIRSAKLFEQAKQCLGQRVMVFGRLTFNSMDQPVLMWASGMEACRPKESLPNITSMSGRISTLKGDLNLGEYIARLRR